MIAAHRVNWNRIHSEHAACTVGAWHRIRDARSKRIISGCTSRAVSAALAARAAGERFCDAGSGQPSLCCDSCSVVRLRSSRSFRAECSSSAVSPAKYTSPCT